MASRKPLSSIKLLINYDYTDGVPSCASMLESAFRRRVQVFRYGEIDPSQVDVVFNTLPKGKEFVRGKFNVWWDIEACSYHVPEMFDSDLVLAPYTYHREVYPENTYFFPFATDPELWHHHDVPQTWDIAFVGREDLNRTKRVEYLNHLAGENFKFLRANGVGRGEQISRLLSSSKIILQVSGDAGSVMETRFFEVGLCGVMAADRTEANQEDLDWAAIPDYHYIAYADKEEMVYKIARMLDNDTARLNMFHAQQNNILSRHTYDKRVADFLDLYSTGKGLENLHKPRRPL